MLKPHSRKGCVLSEVRRVQHGYRSPVPEAEEVEAFVVFPLSPSRHHPAIWGWGQAARRLGYSYTQSFL